MLLSFMNVENVVNPPQNPVVNRSLVLGLRSPLFAAVPDSMPISRHPITFTAIVPMGNDSAVADCSALDMMYLSEPPTKLPHPASSISFIIVLCLCVIV